jgi:EEF1A N-terminal glycine/lysine methyltransferase
MFGATKRAPQLSAAEQHIQLSIRKRATAFVDARDDLETKIGRLSRRLNFLMTESDLWRDKFVTFEQYAEKLSAEAGQLRAKINKEQKETKRLSGIVTLTAVEKTKLQTRKYRFIIIQNIRSHRSELRDTEKAHKDAMLELEKMRETMDKMEQEREEMIAEVEAQIEKALASMAVGMDESDYTDSRPNSRLSSNSRQPRSRKASDATSGMRPLRSIGTESTLAETDNEDGVIKESNKPLDSVDEEPSKDTNGGTDLDPNRKKRFSASELDTPQDTMNAVDEGISIKSDKIARKVLEIEQKVCKSVPFTCFTY